MKKLIVICLVALMSSCAVAPRNYCKDSATITLPKNAQGRIYYSEVITTNGKANELYVMCLKWINTNYRSAKAVLQVNDPDNKLIIVEGYWPINMTATIGSTTAGETHASVSSDLYHNITIECKDGKIKCEVQKFVLETDAVYSSGRLAVPYSRTYPEDLKPGVGFAGCVYDKIDTETKDIFKSLKDYLNNKSDW